jgi:hypothetical protein
LVIEESPIEDYSEIDELIGVPSEDPGDEAHVVTHRVSLL